MIYYVLFLYYRNANLLISLANERTFLSWTRTGLGFVALGVALAKVDALEPLSPALKHDHSFQGPSIALVGAGAGCLCYGTTRYFKSMTLLRKNLFRPNIAGIVLVAATSGLVTGGGITMVIKQESDI